LKNFLIIFVLDKTVDGNFLARLGFNSFSRNISLSNNSIDCIKPNVFLAYNNAETLDLKQNVFRYLIQAYFNGLSNLKVLLLNENHIESFDSNALDQLSNLIFLDLSSNFLQFNSNETFFDGLVNLEKLAIANNRLKNDALTQFWPISNLKKIDLSRNLIDNIDETVFQNLKALVEIKLDGNLLSNLNFSILEPLTQLRVLNLSATNLRSIGTINLPVSIFF
jgi:Leucine-rich repeat (LRR) protein